MASPACPNCGRLTPLPLDVIDSNYVRYYRCHDCEQVWSIQLDRPDAPPWVVSHGRPRTQTPGPDSQP